LRKNYYPIYPSDLSGKMNLSKLQMYSVTTCGLFYCMSDLVLGRKSGSSSSMSSGGSTYSGGKKKFVGMNNGYGNNYYEEANSSQEPARAKIAIIITVVLVCLIVTAIAVYLYMKRNSKEASDKHDGNETKTEEVTLSESVPQSQIVDSHGAPPFAVVLGPGPNNHDTIQNKSDDPPMAIILGTA